MLVSVMRIREVGMRMSHRRVTMPVSMRNIVRHRLVVLMLVMLIVNVLMLVLERFVRVLVFVMFGQMQPNARRH